MQSLLIYNLINLKSTGEKNNNCHNNNNRKKRKKKEKKRVKKILAAALQTCINMNMYLGHNYIP